MLADVMAEYYSQCLILPGQNKSTKMKGENHEEAVDDTCIRNIRDKLDMTIYIPYKYEVLPASVTSYTKFPHD